jgi:hypothetical protein
MSRDPLPERPINIDAYGCSMPSPALTAWSTSSAAALSQLQVAHPAVGGTRAGRRTNTLQLNYAYVLLLSAHFQACCRGLHSGCTQLLVETIDPGIGAVLDTNLSFRRQLDSGNAQPAALGVDFNRFDFESTSSASRPTPTTPKTVSSSRSPRTASCSTQPEPLRCSSDRIR